MKIKHLLLLLALTLSSLFGHAQNIKHINVVLSPDRCHLGFIELFMPDMTFSISQNGALRVRKGKQAASGAYNNNVMDFSVQRPVDNLRLTYYDNFNSNYAGKLKSVGDILIAYNDQFDGFDNRGKVKSIGNLKIAYNDRFDGFDNRGKIKAIGDARVIYYDRFDGADLNGKVKYIGNILIKYYDHFDGTDRAGRIKSITGNMPNISVSNIDEADTGF